MKTLCIVIAALILHSCTTTISRTTYDIKQHMIVTTDSWLDTDDGQKIPVTRGDTLLSTSYDHITDILVGLKTIYFIDYKGTKTYITHAEATAYRDRQDAILTEYDYNTSQQELTFTIKSSQDRDAWARANYYVHTNTDMKIQTANEFLIDTYSPINFNDQAFTISRFPQGDSVQYTVKRGGASPHECAYFILTSKTRKDFYITN